MTGPVPRQHPRATYAVGVLMLVALFAYVDRIIIAVLQEGIRRDLGLSDTELGALTGIGFGVFYTLFAFPVARLADVWVRKYVIAAALAAWSLLTASSGMALGFVTLLLCRMGVAVGEAGSAPTTHSLIADYFPQHRRATALAVWGMMLSAGPMVGFWLGGHLNDAVGWRETFILMGLAGAAVVPVVLFTLPEPRRGAFDDGAPVEVPPALPVAARTLWRLRSFRFLCVGTGLHALSLTAMQNWAAPFYQRSFGLSASEAGFYLALMIGLCGGLGTALGGLLGDRLGRRNVRWYMIIPACATLATIPFALLQFLPGVLTLSLAGGAGVALLSQMYLGPVTGTAQSLVSARMRAVTSATLVIVTNVIGLSMGPLLTGIVSDSLRAAYGDDGLRYAILCTLCANLASGVCYLVAARHLPADRGVTPSHGES
ncbi:MAG: MFS transporter [Alphaproteobacteria bacterium]|nr:MFS transporter [Alphaproteobacteria bacterium]